MNLSGRDAASVGELVAHIKTTLEETFHEVMVQGEITGISMAHSGHAYFNLIDTDASISCAFFRQDVLRHPGFKNIKEGDKVLVYGPVTVYQKRGTFQIQVRHILPAGEGQWRLRFEALKKKLEGEGLFDAAKKRPLPDFARRIALITAPGGAALHDFLNVYSRRSIAHEIVIFPALVQGEKAPHSLLDALAKVKAKGNFDVVILTRGGGSPEDLWCFNHEGLARAIAEFPIPVVSAVGHEVDWTICDYVADRRAETPTAAAELLTQAQTQIKERLRHSGKRLELHLKTVQSNLGHLLERYHPLRLLTQQKLRMSEFNMRVDDLFRSMSDVLRDQFLMSARRADQSYAKLDALDPKKVLTRGYAMIESDNKVVSSLRDWKKLPPKIPVSLVFHDGKTEIKTGDA